MSSVTERLLRFTPTKYALSLVPGMYGGANPRVSSPAPGRSILITSAPRSASICAHVGPARTRVRSKTRRPRSGPVGSGPVLRAPMGSLIGFSSLPGRGAGSISAGSLIGPSPGEAIPTTNLTTPGGDAGNAGYRHNAAARGQHREPRVVDRRRPDAGHPSDLLRRAAAGRGGAEADPGSAGHRPIGGGAGRRTGLGGHRRRRHHDGVAG